MITNLKEDAEAFRLGLLAGTVTVPEVVSWADDAIAAAETPDATIIEIALAGRRSPADVVALLREVPGDADHARTVRRVFRGMLDALKGDPHRGAEIARGLYQLALNGELPEREFGWRAYDLEEAFHLAQTGIYRIQDALADLQRYLEEHSGTS